MLRKIIDTVLRRRHYWRDIGFDELSELYTSQLLRSLAISLMGLFTPIYLYSLGYDIKSLIVFQICWFVLRPFMDIISGFMVAKIGPKHTMLFSSFIHIVYLSLLLTLPDFHWPLFIPALFGSTAYSLHLLAVQVNFSKIKHTNHGGKELGYMVIVERIGGVIGPLVGGFIANYYDPRYTVGLAMIVLIIAVIPLFLSSEPVQTNQHITFRGLPIKRRKFDYISAIPATLENTISIIVWPMYIGIFVLHTNVFVKLGAIAALSTLSSIVLSRSIGGLIDKRKGGKLLKVGVGLNALVHLSRPFVSTPLGAAMVNVANEPITAAYRMPYIKGLFDAADNLPGYRIAYLASISSLDSFMRLLFWLVLWGCVQIYSAQNVFIACFIAAALCSFGILLQRFEALKE